MRLWYYSTQGKQGREEGRLVHSIVETTEYLRCLRERKPSQVVWWGWGRLCVLSTTQCSVSQVKQEEAWAWRASPCLPPPTTPPLKLLTHDSHAGQNIVTPDNSGIYGVLISMEWEYGVGVRVLRHRVSLQVLGAVHCGTVLPCTVLTAAGQPCAGMTLMLTCHSHSLISKTHFTESELVVWFVLLCFMRVNCWIDDVL